MDSLQNIDFITWLNGKLKELNIDENIFGSYIQGILDSDDCIEDKSQELQGILSGILENVEDITKITEEIIDKWKLAQSPDSLACASSSININEKLSKLLESQSLATLKQKEYTDEDIKIRQAILSQYSQQAESEEEEGEQIVSSENKDFLEKNSNAQTVAEAERRKREQSKLESQRKKEKDREDREKQKQLKEEKKEKRKTQKGERKR